MSLTAVWCIRKLVKQRVVDMMGLVGNLSSPSVLMRNEEVYDVLWQLCSQSDRELQEFALKGNHPLTQHTLWHSVAPSHTAHPVQHSAAPSRTAHLICTLQRPLAQHT